jgi:hypothetical protein
LATIAWVQTFAARVLPLLRDLPEDGPDRDVRRLSLLSVEWLRGRTVA